MLLFAIARHIVLDGTNGIELLMGVGSIAGIFAIRKFLYVHSFEPDEENDVFTFLRTGSGDKKKEEDQEL